MPKKMTEEIMEAMAMTAGELEFEPTARESRTTEPERPANELRIIELEKKNATLKAKLAEAKALRGSANIDALIRQRDRLVELGQAMSKAIADQNDTHPHDIARMLVAINKLLGADADWSAYLKADNLQPEGE